MNRYDPEGVSPATWMTKSDEGEYLKRDEVIELLASVRHMVHSGLLPLLGISEEEWDSAIHDAADREDPEPAEYRGDQ